MREEEYKEIKIYIENNIEYVKGYDTFVYKLYLMIEKGIVEISKTDVEVMESTTYNLIKLGNY